MGDHRVVVGLLLLIWGCAPLPSHPDRGAPATAAPVLDVGSLAQRMHIRINAARQEANLAPLEWDDTLIGLAERHSADMARRGFFGHRNPDGADVNARAAAMGLSCEYRQQNVVYSGFGENLFQTYRYTGYETRRTPTGPTVVYDWQTEGQLAEQAVAAWLQSPGHRRNMLSPQYRRHAVGVAFGDEASVYVTDVFC